MIMIIFIMLLISLYLYLFGDLENKLRLYSSVLDSKYWNTVAQGLKYMRSQNVIICGLARDISPGLPDLIKKMELFGSMFKNYKVIIVENDSKDNTRELLTEWQRNNSNIIILGCGVNVNKCELNLPMYGSDIASGDRIKKMSYLRNIYLDYIKQYFNNYDYMTVIDFDIYGSFFMDGVANSFYHMENKQIDALCSNGLNVINNYYDTFAFIELNNNIEYKTLEEKIKHDRDITKKINMRYNDPLYKVKSCFAGLAIYRISKILNNSYDYPKGNILGCEHNYFHKNLNMYLNPSMIYNVIFN